MSKRCALLLLAAAITPLWADLKVTLKTTTGSGSRVDVFYSKQNKRRGDYPETSFSVILDNGTSYYVNNSTREYSVPSGPGVFAILANWIQPPPRIRQSGKTVNVYYERIDTGERRQQFGYTAKHLILRERRVAEPGAYQSSQETMTEGWYIAPGQIKDRLPRYRLLTNSRLKLVDHVVEHGQPLEPGFALFEIRKTKSAVPGLRQVTTEVTALSTEPLAASVFEVPVGFKRVDSLPGLAPSMRPADRLSLEWNQLVQAAESWFY